MDGTALRWVDLGCRKMTANMSLKGSQPAASLHHLLCFKLLSPGSCLTSCLDNPQCTWKDKPSKPFLSPQVIYSEYFITEAEKQARTPYIW